MHDIENHGPKRYAIVRIQPDMARSSAEGAIGVKLVTHTN
jgi:hypothetical protein